MSAACTMNRVTLLNVLQEYIRHQIKLGNDSFSTEKKIYLLNAMFLKQPHGARAA
jgi:hypothetical protein